MSKKTTNLYKVYAFYNLQKKVIVEFQRAKNCKTWQDGVHDALKLKLSVLIENY